MDCRAFTWTAPKSKYNIMVVMDRMLHNRVITNQISSYGTGEV